MNTSMVPACMACTVPDVPFVNTSSDSSICFMDDDDIEIIPSKEYLYTVVKRAHVSNTDLQIVHFQQKKIGTFVAGYSIQSTHFPLISWDVNK